MLSAAALMILMVGCNQGTAIRQIRVDHPGKIAETADGGLYHAAVQARGTGFSLVVSCYDPVGRMLWQEVAAEAPQGREESIRLLDLAGGESGYCAVLYTVAEEDGTPVPRIMVCDGNRRDVLDEAWRDLSFADEPVLPDRLFITQEGKILTIGDSSPYQNGSFSLCTVLYDRQARVAGRGCFPGTGTALLSQAEYDPLWGLYVTASYQITGDDPPSRDTIWTGSNMDWMAENYVDILAYFNVAGQYEWYSMGTSQGAFTLNRFSPAGGNVCLMGGNLPVQLWKLGSEGRLIWRWEDISLTRNPYQFNALVLDTDGRLLITAYRVIRNENPGIMLPLFDAAVFIFGLDGDLLQQIDLPDPVFPESIKVTGGGGFAVEAVQYLKILPAPSPISARWYDTARVIYSFAGSGDLIWTKLIDKYKGSNRTEYGTALAGGGFVAD
ncbi:MAG TPA: hypothetical protein DD727_09975 [Clostridiales bacterium]|nr:hypothetical protein [Clostridiales bacterium]